MKTLTSQELMMVSGGSQRSAADAYMQLLLDFSGAIVGGTLMSQIPIVGNNLWAPEPENVCMGILQTLTGGCIGLFVADTLGQYNLAARANNDAVSANYSMSF